MNGTEVVATTGEPAFAVDLEGRILAWNAAAEHCLGYRSSEVLGRPCWTILQGQDLFSNRYCDENCPVRGMAAKGEPAPGQLERATLLPAAGGIEPSLPRQEHR